MQEETTTAMLGLAGFRVRNAEEVDGELVVEMETADPVPLLPGPPLVHQRHLEPSQGAHL